MKKYFSVITAVAFACFSALSFASCSDDDKNDDPDIPGLTGTTPVSADLTTYAWFSQDMVNLLNIDVTYVDANGITQKAVIGSTPETVKGLGKEFSLYPVKATLSTTKFPAKLDMRIHYTRKAGVTVTPDQVFTFTFISQNEAYVTYKDGQKLGMKNPILEGASLPFKADKLDQMISKFNDDHEDVDVEVERNGKIDF